MGLGFGFGFGFGLARQPRVQHDGVLGMQPAEGAPLQLGVVALGRLGVRLREG